MATFTACCLVTAAIHSALVNAYQLRHYLVVISSLFNLLALLRILHLPKPCGLLQKVIETRKLSNAEFWTRYKSTITHHRQTSEIRYYLWAATLEVSSVFWQRPKHCRTAAKQTFSWTILNTDQQSAGIVNNRAFHKGILGIIVLMLEAQAAALAQLILAVLPLGSPT